MAADGEGGRGGGKSNERISKQGRHRERARERAQSYTLCVSHSPPFFNGASFLLLRKMAGRIEISSSSIQEVGWKRWGSVPVFGKRMEL